MSFYEEWIENKNTDAENRFIEYFLKLVPESTDVFHKGNDAELGTAISVINSVSIERYIAVIDSMDYDIQIEAAQVPQFSDFGDGIYRVPELLEFAPEGMTFEKLGYQLVKSPTEGAGIKYGENHSKLAATMELVEINKRPSNVMSTALGKYLIRFMPDEKKEVLRRLALRQYMAQKIIHDAGDGMISYRKAVNRLSVATAVRRRNNVRVYLEFILKDTPCEKRLSNIDWQVKE